MQRNFEFSFEKHISNGSENGNTLLLFYFCFINSKTVCILILRVAAVPLTKQSCPCKAVRSPFKT